MLVTPGIAFSAARISDSGANPVLS